MKENKTSELQTKKESLWEKTGRRLREFKSVVKQSAVTLRKNAGEVSGAFWELAAEDFTVPESAVRKKLILAVTALGLFFAAMIPALAKFPLSIYPGGIAILAALGGSARQNLQSLGKKKAQILAVTMEMVIFCGVLASCIFIPEKGFFYLLAEMILFLVRAATTGGRLDDSVLTRVTFAAAAGSGLGILLSALEGFTLSSVLAAVSLGILTPVFTYLLSGFYYYTAFSARGVRTASKKMLYLEAMLGTLLFLFLYALREVQVLNFSLVFVLSVIVTLLLSRFRGALYGAAAGLICGMACGGEIYAPILAIAGFFSGLFFEYSGVVAMMIAFISACGYAILSGGFDVFSLISVDFACALVLFFPLHRMIPRESGGKERMAAQEVIQKESRSLARRKLKTMSEAFSSLSEVFYTVSDTMKKPQITETTLLISNCCSEICSKCAISSLCWGKNFASTNDATAKAAAQLLSAGVVSEDDFSGPLAAKCPNLGDLVELINRRFERLNGNFYKNNKTRLLAGEYSSVSRLLKNSAGELDKELEYNPALESKSKAVLKRLGIVYRHLAVFGTREMKIDVYGVVVEKISKSADEIVEAFEKEFRCRFEAPSFVMLEESAVMRLRRRRSLALECAKSGCTKKGEVLNGDSATFFETDHGYFYTLICDGMGSGREAAFTSRLAAIFIEKLMTCASPKNVTLEMLNTFLMSKTDETFTTVDLLEVDLLSGEGSFMKAGAAPSFIIRGDRIHKIASLTPPAGILAHMCAEQTKMKLLPGDLVLMLSDGALSGEEDEGAMMKLLAEKRFETAKALCDAVFDFAKVHGAFRDDMSVSVVRVEKAED